MCNAFLLLAKHATLIGWLSSASCHHDHLAELRYLPTLPILRSFVHCVFVIPKLLSAESSLDALHAVC
jgi:hypothetical protein